MSCAGQVAAAARSARVHLQDFVDAFKDNGKMAGK